MKWLVTSSRNPRAWPNYERWLSAGGVDWVIAGSADGDSPAEFHALLLSGGGDVHPRRYGALAVHPATCNIDERRDEREFALVSTFLLARKPVFGICRGLQVINTALGGRLIQHVPHAVAGGASEQHEGRDGRDAVHPIRWNGSARMSRRLGSTADVNSSHHQAIDPGALAASLAVAAVSPGGIIEAIESLDGSARIVAVQWHPERLDFSHPGSGRLLDYLKSMVRDGPSGRETAAMPPTGGRERVPG
jgi:putative glutamine amidotransferase